MSSTGVRDSSSTEKRVIKGLILNEAQFIQSLRVFANTSTLSGLGATEGEINNSPIEASGNYLSKLGDKMLGPLALAPPLDFTIEIDANNTIDIGPLNDNAQYTSNVQLDSIQPNGFILDIIANAAFDGQLLFLRTFAPTVPFTISQGTLGNGGNIQTGDDNDLTVGDLQTVTLIFDEALKIGENTGGSWRVLSVSSGGGGSTVPDPTAEFQHLQSDGANNWVAQQELEFGALSADSGQIRIPNDTIGIAWRNATDDGNLEIKGTTAGNLDITRDDNTSISLSLRSQNAIEADQVFSVTVGSGSITSADVVIDASTAKLLIAVGGATRLTIDATVTTAMTLKSPSGVTAQSSFDVVSTHVTEADQNISIFVGSGNSADAVLSTSANIFKLAVNNTVRWELDVNIGNEITQTGFGVNPLYTLFNDDSTPNDFDLLGRINFSGRNSNADKIIYAGIFVESSDVSDNSEDAIMYLSIIQAGVISPLLQLEPFIMKLNNSSMELDEITLPANPAANKGLFYLRDVAGITTPFFLDSSGTETSMIAGGITNEITQGDSFVRVTDTGVGSISMTVDATEFISLGGGSVTITQNAALQGFTDIQGNVDLGNASTDTITFEGRVDSDIIPDGGGTRILGDTTNNWSSVFSGRINLVAGGSVFGRMLVDGDGVEIEALLSGDFIELKTQGTVRANFKAEADGGITFFEPFEINDEMRIDGGNMIHAHDSVECGFAVTDDITSPGSFGTIQGPVNSGSATDAADADTDFGSALGCVGLYLSGGGTPVRVTKILLSPTTWATELLVSSGNVIGGRLT